MTVHCGRTATNAHPKNWESLREPSFDQCWNPLIHSAETETCRSAIYRKRNGAKTELFNSFGAETETRTEIQLTSNCNTENYQMYWFGVVSCRPYGKSVNYLCQLKCMSLVQSVSFCVSKTWTMLSSDVIMHSVWAVRDKCFKLTAVSVNRMRWSLDWHLRQNLICRHGNATFGHTARLH